MKAIMLDENNVVINIIEVDDMNILPNLYPWVEGVNIGDIFTNNVPVRPPVDMVALKEEKNRYINRMREFHNNTYFPFDGKHISCDSLSRSDLDGVAISIALTAAFPEGFGGLWKAIDNTYVVMDTADKFKEMYAAMVLQGNANFEKSQSLKLQLQNATTEAEVQAVSWSN